MKTVCFVGSILLLMCVLIGAVQAQSPEEVLKQYISDLRKNPNDYALREKIIKHVQGMGQKPAIPEETRRFMARGIAAVKGGKNDSDFKDAVKEFEKASLVAPWLVFGGGGGCDGGII